MAERERRATSTRLRVVLFVGLAVVVAGVGVSGVRSPAPTETASASASRSGVVAADGAGLVGGHAAVVRADHAAARPAVRRHDPLPALDGVVVVLLAIAALGVAVTESNDARRRRYLPAHLPARAPPVR